MAREKTQFFWLGILALSFSSPDFKNAIDELRNVASGKKPSRWGNDAS